MTFATFKPVEDVTPQDMWSITAQSICLSNQSLIALMEEPIWMTMTSTPLWMTTREMVCIEPGAWIYEGGNVTISFLSHVFFLVSVLTSTSLPYMRRLIFTYLLFHPCTLLYVSLSSFLSRYRTVSPLDYLSHDSHISPTFHTIL